MPRKNRTGPNGKEPGTGRGMGPCKGGINRGQGTGKGGGQGRGQGGGRGQKQSKDSGQNTVSDQENS